MGGIHRRHQHAGRQTHAQRPHVYPQSEGKRQGERDETKGERDITVAHHVRKVHAERRHEHNIIETHLTEDLETGVAVEQVHTMRPDHHTDHNQPHNGGNTKAFEEHGREENHTQHHEEYPRRIGDGKRNKRHVRKINARNRDVPRGKVTKKWHTAREIRDLSILLQTPIHSFFRRVARRKPFSRRISSAKSL